MQVRTVMITKAIVGLVLGVVVLAVPGISASLFGVTLDAGGALAFRLYAASAVGHGCANWFARNSGPSEARRALILGGFVYDGIGFVVALVAVLSGAMNPLGWLAVILYLLLTVGFGYFLVR